MEEENITGKMVENMKDSTNMIKNMEWELILGLMEDNMLENGITVKDMAREKSSLLIKAKDKEYGKKIEE